jgi:hypothetical protein
MAPLSMRSRYDQAEAAADARGAELLVSAVTDPRSTELTAIQSRIPAKKITRKPTLLR